MDDRDASAEFTKYYEEHKNSIFTYILYRVSFNRSVAEDLTSEIFLKAFRHFETFDRSRSFKTWIYTIAHNHLVNYFISKKETLSLDDAMEVIKTERIEDSLEKIMQIENVMDLMAKLSPRQRELITMRYVNDLSHHEMATILRKEEGAIRTGLSRAISELRKLYDIHHQKP